MTKQQLWDQAAARVDKITDRLGKPVDAEIKEMVVALNALGINTTSSCEGHVDWGTGFPWVDIESPDIAPLDQKIKQLRDNSPDDFFQKDEFHDLVDKVTQLNLQERAKLLPLLEEFYKTNPAKFGEFLVINDEARGWGRLQPHGGPMVKIEPEAKQKVALKQFQGEMAAFTDFLKQKFFSG